LCRPLVAARWLPCSCIERSSTLTTEACDGRAPLVFVSIVAAPPDGSALVDITLSSYPSGRRVYLPFFVVRPMARFTLLDRAALFSSRTRPSAATNDLPSYNRTLQGNSFSRPSPSYAGQRRPAQSLSAILPPTRPPDSFRPGRSKRAGYLCHQPDFDTHRAERLHLRGALEDTVDLTGPSPLKVETAAHRSPRRRIFRGTQDVRLLVLRPRHPQRLWAQALADPAPRRRFRPRPSSGTAWVFV